MLKYPLSKEEPNLYKQAHNLLCYHYNIRHKKRASALFLCMDDDGFTDSPEPDR